MRKLACPPAADSARDHFSDADYETKDVCDEHGQTVSIKVSFLVKDIVSSEIFLPHMNMHLQTIVFFDQETADIRGQSDAYEATSRNQVSKLDYRYHCDLSLRLQYSSTQISTVVLQRQHIYDP